MSLDELRREIRNADKFNSREALRALRAIEQRMMGEKATQRLSNTHVKGSAAWAYAELGAAPKTPYSWAALDAKGHVVINLWDDKPGWHEDTQGRWCPKHLHGARKNVDREANQQRRALGTRTEFFKLLEVAVAEHRSEVRAVISTAEDINSIPRKRLTGLSRPWLNEDGSAVLLRIIDLDIKQWTFNYELVDSFARPRCPFR